jgi:hypothetical protein
MFMANDSGTILTAEVRRWPEVDAKLQTMRSWRSSFTIRRNADAERTG